MSRPVYPPKVGLLGRMFAALRVGGLLACLGVLIMGGMVACQPPASQRPERLARARIDTLEQRGLRYTGIEPDSEQYYALSALTAYQEYLERYPRDTAAPEYAFKAGQIYYTYLNEYNAGERYLRRLVDSFPGHRLVPVSRFMLGNLYQDRGDTAQAIRELDRLITEFPRHDLAAQAALLKSFIRRGGLVIMPDSGPVAEGRP